MYVIMAYDVSVNRVDKVLKIARKYLRWVQNSLLEGELTVAQFERLKLELKSVINENEDSIAFYILESKKLLKRQTMGIEKGFRGNII